MRWVGVDEVEKYDERGPWDRVDSLFSSRAPRLSTVLSFFCR